MLVVFISPVRYLRDFIVWVVHAENLGPEIAKLVQGENRRAKV